MPVCLSFRISVRPSAWNISISLSVSLCVCLSVCLSVCMYVCLFSSGPPVTGSQSHFAMFTGRSSDVKFFYVITLATFFTHFSRVHVVVIVFLPATMSLFAQAICCPPCVLLVCVYTISTYYFQFLGTSSPLFIDQIKIYNTSLFWMWYIYTKELCSFKNS
jgi:hypothetical protein